MAAEIPTCFFNSLFTAKVLCLPSSFPRTSFSSFINNLKGNCSVCFWIIPRLRAGSLSAADPHAVFMGLLQLAQNLMLVEQKVYLLIIRLDLSCSELFSYYLRAHIIEHLTLFLSAKSLNILFFVENKI